MISRLWKRKSPENLGNIRRDLERENRNTQQSSKSKTIKKEQSTISNINSCTLNAPKNILTPWLRMKPDSRLADPEIRVERGAFNREPLIIDERGNAIFWVRSPFVRGSVQRLNMVTRQIIGLQIDSAIAQMHFSPRRAALLVGDVLLFEDANEFEEMSYE